MQEVTVKAPCKINIGLNVINKRPDGYHNIETIFYPVNLYDVITFAPSDKLSFSTDSLQLSNEQDNLILKAVRLLEEYTSQKILLKIHLKKEIPVGAGLGGGSSDAATTLKTINKLYNFKISDNVLHELALKLGSDAPFFIKNKPCLASSRGEILTEIGLDVPFPILLVNPGVNISTKWAFENIAPKRGEKSMFEYKDQLKELKKLKDVKNLKNFVSNDFEEIVFNEFPVVKNIKGIMYLTSALFSSMTGTGSTVFGIYRNNIEAEKMAFYFKEMFGFFTFISSKRAP